MKDSKNLIVALVVLAVLAVCGYVAYRALQKYAQKQKAEFVRDTATGMIGEIAGAVGGR